MSRLSAIGATITVARTYVRATVALDFFVFVTHQPNAHSKTHDQNISEKKAQLAVFTVAAFPLLRESNISRQRRGSPRTTL